MTQGMYREIADVLFSSESSTSWLIADTDTAAATIAHLAYDDGKWRKCKKYLRERGVNPPGRVR